MKVPHVVLKERSRHVATNKAESNKNNPTMAQIRHPNTANQIIPP